MLAALTLHREGKHDLMDVKDAVVVITGGAGGIGAALARRFAADGARRVVVADRELARRPRPWPTRSTAWPSSSTSPTRPP